MADTKNGHAGETNHRSFSDGLNPSRKPPSYNPLHQRKKPPVTNLTPVTNTPKQKHKPISYAKVFYIGCGLVGGGCVLYLLFF